MYVAYVADILCIIHVSTHNTLDSTPCKRGRPKKVAVCLDDLYPALNQMAVNPEEERAASEALNREMTNDKPRRSVFLPLMKTTFTLRRHYILHDASSVQDIIQL